MTELEQAVLDRYQSKTLTQIEADLLSVQWPNSRTFFQARVRVEPEKDKRQCCKIMQVDNFYLLELLRGNYRVSFEPPLPSDAEIVALNAEWAGILIQFKVCSLEWPEVPRGEIPPRWDGQIILAEHEGRK